MNIFKGSKIDTDIESHQLELSNACLTKAPFNTRTSSRKITESARSSQMEEVTNLPVILRFRLAMLTIAKSSLCVVTRGRPDLLRFFTFPMFRYFEKIFETAPCVMLNLCATLLWVSPNRSCPTICERSLSDNSCRRFMFNNKNKLHFESH